MLPDTDRNVCTCVVIVFVFRSSFYDLVSTRYFCSRVTPKMAIKR